MASLKDWLIAALTRLFPGPMNRIKINIAVRSEKQRRPHPFSLWTGPATGEPPKRDPDHAPSPEFKPSTYVSWPGLADRSFTGRHLPPSKVAPHELPDAQEVFDKLFRREDEMIPCKKTSALFCFFAQWFTDSFLRTDPDDRRRHTGNNEIDYCQIYGLHEDVTKVLRSMSGGLMRMREEDGRSLLPFLVRRDGSDEYDPHFAALPYLKPGYREKIAGSLGQKVLEPERWDNMYATGLDRGNSTIFYTALSTMCIREHNRIARELQKLGKGWDDDRLFETARLINVHNVLEIVIEDYINHIAGDYDFKLDSTFAEREPWYRTNRISLEFNLLYRWHSLVPEAVTVEGERLDHLGYRFNNIHLERRSPEVLINAASEAPAGRIGLRNTPKVLEKAELSSIHLAREFRLQSFNAYRERFGHPPYRSIEELAEGDDRAIAVLNELYDHDVNKVEYLVGLYAERRNKNDPDAVLPPLLKTMVAVDAFTHILTNPVLSGQVYEAAFEKNGLLPFITEPGGVAGLMERNSQGVRAVPSFSVRRTAA